MYADLHLHSTYSDGNSTPDELVAFAKNNQLQVIAISDHDTVTGYLSIADKKDLGIKIIPAIEISTVLRHSYLHILGYYINALSPALNDYIIKVSSEKTENTRINFENALQQVCFSYHWKRVLELNASQPRISGVHVVQSMQKDNYSIAGMDLWDMFYKYFRAESPDFIPTETATAFDAIDIIKKTGGIPVIAHPKSAGDDNIVLELIRYGAEGLEVFNPIHSYDDEQKYEQMAKQNGIYITGGTDWHGNEESDYVNNLKKHGLKDNKYSILSVRV